MNNYEKLNNYLEEQNPKQRLMLYFAVAIFIIIGGYYLVGMDLEEETQMHQSRIMRAQAELRKFSPQALKSKVKQIQREIENKKAEINSQEVKIKQIRYDFAGDTPIEPKGEQWAKFLEDLLDKANSLNINFQSISTEPLALDKQAGLIAVKSLKLEGSSKYQNIEKLIRYIEARSFLVKIKYAKITQEQNKLPEFDISFFVLGVKIWKKY